MMPVSLHSDSALEAILGKRIVSRETIHQWPLSTVQAIILEDQTRFAYKAQIPPTVEKAFYECARSPLLPKHIDTGMLDDTQTMLLDWIHAPRLDQLDVNSTQKIAIGKAILESIGQIKGDLPCYLDLGTRSNWRNFCNHALSAMNELVKIERLQRVTTEGISAFERCIDHPDLLTYIDKESRLIHGDLTAGQIYWAEDAQFVIDWQRPIIAPAQVDLATLLINLKINPIAYVAREAIQVHWILLLNWAVFAQGKLFPEQRWPVFDEWVSTALTNLVVLSK